MIMGHLLTYDEFKRINDQSKKMGVTCGHIDNVDLKAETCVLAVFDNRTPISIQNLVADITVNGMGCVSNPSAIKEWKGWG